MQIWLLIIEGSQNNQKDGLKWRVEKDLINEKAFVACLEQRRPPAPHPAGLLPGTRAG